MKTFSLVLRKRFIGFFKSRGVTANLKDRGQEGDSLFFVTGLEGRARYAGLVLAPVDSTSGQICR